MSGATTSASEEVEVGVTPEWLEAFRDVEVDDLVGGPGDGPIRLVVVGINPSLMTAATGTHFAHPSNRFYPALYRAGITARQLPRGVAHTPRERAELTGRGIAITNLVRRATARASELGDDELRAGVQELVAKLAVWRPTVVAVAGVTAYRTAFRRPRAAPGRQPQGLAGAQLWVTPNPSGLNAHETVASLADSYQRVAAAAGW